MKHVLDQCRARFGDPPRELEPGEQRKFRIWPPPWCLIVFDPLLRIYRDQGKLRDRGYIVWGYLVQANMLLFQRGIGNCPANVIYDPDPSGNARPADLAPIARSLFDLKGRRTGDRELDECARWVTNETLRKFDAPVPLRLTRGRSVLFSTIMVHRKHLPGGYLSCSFFPLLINPEETTATMILPHHYWPEGVEVLGT